LVTISQIPTTSSLKHTTPSQTQYAHVDMEQRSKSPLSSRVTRAHHTPSPSHASPCRRPKNRPYDRPPPIISRGTTHTISRLCIHTFQWLHHLLRIAVTKYLTLGASPSSHAVAVHHAEKKHVRHFGNRVEGGLLRLSS
jgi:hypothetical protein